MTDKQLKSKAIDIHGKKYVQVKDRIIYFNETYPNGMIETRIVTDSDKVVMKAKVIPDVAKPERYFTGISASNPSKQIEKQVPHEVAETSAVGRALALMGIGVIDSVASVDEMNKAGVSNTHTTQHIVEPVKNEFSNSECEHCGGKIKMSMAGKPYCENKCWLPENKHLRTK